MISSPFSSFSKRPGATLAGISSLALSSILLLCGAGSVPVQNLLPQGAMQGDLNAGGHDMTNAANVSATNTISAPTITASTTLNAPSGFFSANNLVQTTGSYANPSWLTSLAYSKLTGTPSFSTGLTFSSGNVTVNTSQNIATLSNLTTNGFVKTGGGAGTLSIDTTTYTPTSTTVNGHALSSNVTVSASDITTGTLPIGQVPTGTTSSTVPLGNDTRFPASVTGLRNGAGAGSADVAAIADADYAFAPYLPPSQTLGTSEPYIIYDDDFITDEDGMQDLSAFSAMMDNGECKIIAAVCDQKDPYGAPAIQACLNYFGKGQIPVGQYTGSVAAAEGSSNCGAYMGSPSFGLSNSLNLTGTNSGTFGTSAITVLRTALARLPEATASTHPVRFYCSGASTVMYEFYNSAADSISGYTGAQLLSHKVGAYGEVVRSAGIIPSTGAADYNENLDPSGRSVWASIAALGIQVTIAPVGGTADLSYTTTNNYCPWMPAYSPAVVGQGTNSGHKIYPGAIYAVRGATWGGVTYFDKTSGTYNITSGAVTSWTAGSGTNEQYLSFHSGITGAGTSKATSIDANYQPLVTQANSRSGGNQSVTPLLQVPTTFNCTTISNQAAFSVTDKFAWSSGNQFKIAYSFPNMTGGKAFLSMGGGAHVGAFMSYAYDPTINNETLALGIANASVSQNILLVGDGRTYLQGTDTHIASGLLYFDTAGKGISGTATNNSASAGVVGEIVTSAVASGSAVSLTTATTANVTSISLTAGDWDVQGNVNFTDTSATVTATEAGLSTTSVTLPTDGTEVYSGTQLTTTTSVDSVALPRKRVSISSTTTVYLEAQQTFSAGTAAAFGSISARRVR